MTTHLGQFPPARVLPVILLAYCSGSMSEDGKIESLNHAIRTMVRVLAGADDRDSEIHLAIVGIGGEVAELRHPFTPISQFVFEPLLAGGGTPTGSAIELAAQPSRTTTRFRRTPTIRSSCLSPTGIRPTTSIGPSTDSSGPNSERRAPGSLLVSAPTSAEIIERSASDGVAGVLGTDQIADIDRFFRFVTRTVTSRLPTMTHGGVPTDHRTALP